MDNRKLLPSGYKISFPGMECEIEKSIGKGSNGIVYICRYPDALNTQHYHRVLIKELFPYHTKNLIYRDDNGCIITDEKAKDYYNLQRLSFENGNRIHLHILELHPEAVGSNINTFSANNTLYSVMGFDGGRSLDKEFSQGASSLRQAASVIYDILNSLEIFHTSGYLHLDISPDNILIIGNGETSRIELIDFNSIHSIAEIKNGNTAYCSAKEGYTSPEVINSDMAEINESSDIYSVTAVLYRLVAGKALTLLQRISKKPPAAPKNGLTENLPETVIRQLSVIFAKGLNSVPSKRYSDCESMKKDIAELINRIDGIGITHAALWESGKRELKNMIRSNTSLSYLTGQNELYPLRVTLSDNESTDILSAVNHCFNNKNIFLTGSGGMGKTTALLHIAGKLTENYSSFSPAAIYISLFNYNGSENHYIKNRILQMLKFDKNILDFEDARSRLIQLLDSPCIFKGKESPACLLLIDGFNEASGDLSPLINEIEQLSSLSGVRIILTSRTVPDINNFITAVMSPLSEDDIRSTLIKHNLLFPESAEIRDILTIPLMLSVFCKTAENTEKQVICKSAVELLDEFLNGICEKECRLLPENDARRWCIKAAVYFVLPFICAYENKKGSALTEAALLKITKRCFRALSHSRLRSLFPSWTGHIKDIRNNAKNAEEWYGTVILDILWQKTGLLIKDGNRYRVMHQRIAEHLIPLYRKINKKLSLFNIAVAASFTLSAVCIAVLIASVISPQQYDKKKAKLYMENITVGLSYNGNEITLMRDVIEAYKNEDSLLSVHTQSLSSFLELHSSVIENGYSGSASVADSIMKEMKSTGKVFPWSGKPLDTSAVDGIYGMSREITEEYTLYLDVLNYIIAADKNGTDFIEALYLKTEADAALSDALFYQVFYPHLDAMKDSEPDEYAYFEPVISANADLSDKDSSEPDEAELGRLRKEREEATQKLEGLPIFTEYRRNYN